MSYTYEKYYIYKLYTICYAKAGSSYSGCHCGKKNCLILLLLEEMITMHGNYSWEWQTSCTRRLTQHVGRLLIQSSPDIRVCWDHCITSCMLKVITSYSLCWAPEIRLTVNDEVTAWHSLLHEQTRGWPARVRYHMKIIVLDRFVSLAFCGLF